MISDLAYLLGGVCVGGAVAALLARWRIRRLLAKARIAERRARDAERMAEIGAMTRGLAHEIKNPLSTIGLNAQLLAEGIEDWELGPHQDTEDKLRLVRRVGALRREVDRLRGILQDFLTYAGELRPELGAHNLNQVVDELADFFRPQAIQNGVSLRVDLAPGELPAMIDPALVKQAVLNLMLNAMQAMTGPGLPGAGVPRELIVRTRRVREPDGVASAAVHVIDTGPGIAPEVAAKLFTPYFTTKAGGSGLGLATTRRIALAHSGRVDVHTEPGKGTDFVLSFPVPAGV